MTARMLADGAWKTTVALALVLGLGACAQKGEPVASDTAAPAASDTPAAAAAAPQAPASAAVVEVTPAEGPYLYTLLEDAALQRAWAAMSAKAPRWVRDAQGPAVPALKVNIDGHTYWQGSVCQQHNCPNTFFYLLSAERAYGVHGDFGQKAAQLKRLKPAFHGEPPAAERAVLQALFEEERKRQLGEHPR